jgi:hypothetical protein
MPSKAFLRTLIVAELVLGGTSATVSLATESWLPEPLRAFLEAEAAADMTPWEESQMAVAILLLVAVLVLRIGRLLLWRPARTQCSTTFR